MINNLKIKNLYYLNKISLIFIITYSNELNIYFTFQNFIISLFYYVFKLPISCII